MIALGVCGTKPGGRVPPLRPMKARKIAVAALSLVAALALSADASAKPKPTSTKSQTTKHAPRTRQPIPTHKTLKPGLGLDPKVLRESGAARRLGPKAKTKLLLGKGVTLPSNELGKAVVLSVRRPWLNAAAHLTFVGMITVMPGDQGGFAVIGEISKENDYDDRARPAPASPIPGAFGGFNECDIVPILCAPIVNPNGAAPKPTRGMSYATVRFRAAKNKMYVVDCFAAGESEISADVTAAKSLVASGAVDVTGHVLVTVPSSTSKRDVRIDLFSTKPWTLRKCEISPVG